MPELNNKHTNQESHADSQASQDPRPTAEEIQTQQPLVADQHNPRVIEDLHLAICLTRVLDMGDAASDFASKARVERLLESASQTNDPIEAMMIEQICIAHHRIASLHARAAKSDDIVTIDKYSSAAQRLLGEWRRLVRDLQEYRTPAQNRQTTVIHKVEQLNQADHQDVAFAKAEGPEGGSRMEARDSELTSKTGTGIEDVLHDARQNRLKESATNRGRQAEPAEAR